jgi:hypothetical protein
MEQARAAQSWLGKSLANRGRSRCSPSEPAGLSGAEDQGESLVVASATEGVCGPPGRMVAERRRPARADAAAGRIARAGSESRSCARAPGACAFTSSPLPSRSDPVRDSAPVLYSLPALSGLSGEKRSTLLAVMQAKFSEGGQICPTDQERLPTRLEEPAGGAQETYTRLRQAGPEPCETALIGPVWRGDADLLRPVQNCGPAS